MIRLQCRLQSLSCMVYQYVHYWYLYVTVTKCTMHLGPSGTPSCASCRRVFTTSSELIPGASVWDTMDSRVNGDKTRDPKDACSILGAIGCLAPSTCDLKMLVCSGHLISSLLELNCARNFLPYCHSLGLPIFSQGIPLCAGKHETCCSFWRELQAQAQAWKRAHVKVKTIKYRARITMDRKGSSSTNH